MSSILIVDDDINLCSALKDELIDVGYYTEFVNSGDDAIKYLSHKAVDLILLDLKMPKKDGFEILKEIQQKKINSKIVVLTAYTDVKSAIDSARMGANDFISKPYDLDELLLTIRKVLQKD
ncbi:MAG: response regulator [Ignavibacteriaceae bacterium]